MVDLDATDWRVARFLHAILDRGNFPNWSRLTMGGHDAGLGGRHIMTEEAGDRTEALRRRRVPCMIAFLHPFRLVDVDGVAAWNAPIEQINGGWDYVALHRLVGGDVGLEPPYPLVVGRDGALALPPLADLRSLQLLVEAPYFQGKLLQGDQPGWPRPRIDHRLDLHPRTSSLQRS